MALPGEVGPIQHARTTPLNGVPAHSNTVLTGEFPALEAVDPSSLIDDARGYLLSFGVDKHTDMGRDGVFVVIGEPVEVVHTGKRLVVWKIINDRIRGWGALTKAPNDCRKFTATSTGEGVYTEDQLYVMNYDDGLSLYDNGSAMTLSDSGRIVYNAHAPGYSGSVYHEVFHTFQGSGLSSVEAIREGVIEHLAGEFARSMFGQMIPIYPGYQNFVPDALKMVQFTSLATVVRAFFADEGSSIQELMPLFYGPTANTYAGTQRLSSNVATAVATVSAVKTFLGQSALRAPNSWYRKWCAAHGRVPTGGVTLPVSTVPSLGGLPPPPPAMSKANCVPPPPPLVRTVGLPSTTK